MAAVEKVIIKVEVDADINDDLAAIEARFKALEKRCRSLNDACCKREKCIDDAGAGCKKLEDTAKGVKKLDKNTKDLDKSTDKARKKFNLFTTILGSFWRGLKKVIGMIWSFLKLMNKISFIALAAEIAIFTTALLAVKAALVTGRAAASVWQITMASLSATAASVATALAVAAAAMRQYKEAQLIPVMGGGPGGRAASTMLNRSFSSQTQALYGSESMAAVTAALAGAGIQRGNIIGRQLYNISGGDEKSAISLAQAFEEANRSGDTSELISTLKSTRGFEKGSISEGASLESIVATISSGAGTTEAYKNVAEDMGNTFIGVLKTEFETIKNMFADAGTMLLNPFQEAFQTIARIVKDDLLGIFQILREFGPDSLAPSLVSFADAVSEFIRSNIVKHVSDISSTAEKLKKFFDKVGDWYKRTKDWFKSYEEAANVVTAMMKALLGASNNGLFRSFADQIVENAEKFIEFGAKIGEVLNAIKQGFAGGNAGFFGQLDTLSAILSAIANSLLPNLFKVQATFASLFEKLPEIITLVSDRLGPILVNIFEAFKPVADNIIVVFEGVLNILDALEPIIVALAKAVEILLVAADVVPGGSTTSGIAALALMGGLSGGRGTARRRLRRKALKRFAKKYGLKKKFRSLGKLARNPKVLKGAGAVIGTGIAAKGFYDTYNEGVTATNALQSIGGATMAGASIGAMFGPHGAAVGAAAGAIVGAIGLGISAWARDKRIKEASEKLGDDFVSGIKNAFQGGEVKNGFTAEEFAQVQDLSKLAKAAESSSVKTYDELYNLLQSGASMEQIKQLAKDSGFDDVANAYSFNRMKDIITEGYESNTKIYDGDNDEMKAFVQAAIDSGFIQQIDPSYAGMDINDIHLDEFAEKISRVNGALDYYIGQETQRQLLLADAIEDVAESLGLTSDTIQEFMDEMGLFAQHAHEINQLALRNLYALYNAPTIDLEQGFSADLTGALANQNELAGTLVSSYNSLIDEAALSQGNVSTDMMSSYLQDYASYSVAMGGNAATGQLAGVQSIIDGMASGEISRDLAKYYDFDSIIEGIIKEQSTTYGLPFEMLMDAFQEGGVAGLETLLKDESEIRETGRDIFFGTGGLEGRTSEEINDLLNNDTFTTLAADAVASLGAFSATQFESLGEDSEARLAFLEDKGLLTQVFRQMAQAGESVFGFDLSDPNDRLVAGLEGVVTAIQTNQPQVNLSINGEEQDRAGGQVALVSVSWTSSAAQAQHQAVSANRSGVNPNG